MLPGRIDEKLAEKVEVCDNTNDIVESHNGIFIHALHEKMPECDLKRGVNSLEDIKEGDMCHVYCAQSTCSAAIRYMNDHTDKFSKCGTIHYVHRGSIDIKEEKLVDGMKCHSNIEAYNNTQ